MELIWAKLEEGKKDLCIISLDQLKLDEEVKRKVPFQTTFLKDDDDDAYHAEEDTDTLQEELLDEVSVLPTDPETKKTEMLVQKALQSVDIIKYKSKLTPAS